MDIHCDASIPFPRPLVFTTYRDHLIDLLPHLPNIRGIEIKERTEDDGVVHLVNIWHGGGDIPSVARSFVSESMLSWTDLATWHKATFSTDWRVQPHAFAEAVSSSGKNRYFERGEATVLQIRGTLTVDASKIRGVPRLLAGRVSRVVEQHVVKLVEKNLLDVAAGVTGYLRDRK